LTITSFLYNPSHSKSDWIDRIFGAKSVFYKDDRVDSFLSEKRLYREEIESRFRDIKTVFRLPEYAIWPPCSIEMLGFVRTNHIFVLERTEPVFGLATVSISNSTYVEKWKCFYRPLFENWRQEHKWVKLHFWALTFYCPAFRAEDSCAIISELMSKKKTVSIDVNMESTVPNTKKTSQWHNSFNARILDREIIVGCVKYANFYRATKIK